MDRARGQPLRHTRLCVVGVAEVVSEVLIPLARDWSQLRILRAHVIPGQPVIVFARYVGVHRASGRRLNAQALHLWDIADGRVNRYRGYADTLALTVALNGGVRAGAR